MAYEGKHSFEFCFFLTSREEFLFEMEFIYPTLNENISYAQNASHGHKSIDRLAE